MCCGHSIVAARPRWYDTSGSFSGRWLVGLGGPFQFGLERVQPPGGVDLIYTLVYAPTDQAHVDRIVRSFEACGGRVVFVQLVAPPEELHRRVSNPSRSTYGKLVTTRGLDDLLTKHDLYQTVANRPSLVIDTAELSVDEAADRIVEHLSTG